LILVISFKHCAACVVARGTRGSTPDSFAYSELPMEPVELEETPMRPRCLHREDMDEEHSKTIEAIIGSIIDDPINS
jgi:hypothetical protein